MPTLGDFAVRRCFCTRANNECIRTSTTRRRPIRRDDAKLFSVHNTVVNKALGIKVRPDKVFLSRLVVANMLFTLTLP